MGYTKMSALTKRLRMITVLAGFLCTWSYAIPVEPVSDLVLLEDGHELVYERNSSSSLITTTDINPKDLDVRGLEDVIWGKSLAAGKQLKELMLSPTIPKNLQTKWTEYSAIEQHGWRQNKKAVVNKDESTSAQPVVDALKLPEFTDKSWKLIEWVHTKETKIKNSKGAKVKYPPTEGTYRALYNPSHGIIIATDNKSPSYKASINDQPASSSSNANKSPGPIIPLNHWSDITYLTWANLCTKAHVQPNRLKYVIRLNVVNPEANIVLSRIAGKSMEDYDKPYPGDKITNIEEADAVLGFPLGRSIAYLLIQHKETLGQRKTVKEVKFWDSKNGKEEQGKKLPGLQAIPNMMYTLS